MEAYGEAPQRVAFDGGYASRANLADAKELGVEHVMFHKKRGMEASEMTPSAWIYGQLKRFRAGVEAGISYLKRCFRAGPLSVARLGTFPGVRALGSVRPQSDTAGSLTAILTPVGRRGSSTSDLLSRSFLTDRCVSIAADPERPCGLMTAKTESRAPRITCDCTRSVVSTRPKSSPAHQTGITGQELVRRELAIARSLRRCRTSPLSPSRQGVQQAIRWSRCAPEDLFNDSGHFRLPY